MEHDKTAGLATAFEAVTTHHAGYETIRATIEASQSIEGLKGCNLSPYFPNASQRRLKFVLKVLGNIATHPGYCKRNIIQYLGSSEGNTISTVDYLYGIGYINKVDKVRLIKPLQRYKVDTGYVVTFVGESVLYKIVSGL